MKEESLIIDENIHEYVYLWSKTKYLSGFITLLLSFSGFIFFIQALNEFILKGFLNIFQIIYISTILEIFMIIYFLFRNKNVIRMIKKDRNNLYKLSIKGNNHMIIILVALALYFTLDYIYAFFDMKDMYLHMMPFAIALIVGPRVEMYNDCLTEKGKTEIEFENITLNINDYEKLQFWLRNFYKHFIRVLKIGYIDVSLNSLLFYTNKKLADSTEIMSHIQNIKRWLEDERKNHDIINILKEIVPDDSILPLKKISQYEHYLNIIQPYEKLITVIIILITTILKIYYS